MRYLIVLFGFYLFIIYEQDAFFNEIRARFCA